MQNRSSVKSNDNVFFRWLGLLGMAVLIVFGTFSPIFTLAAFGVAVAQIVFGEEAYSWQMIFMMSSFSVIIKLSPGSTSLFTYIILLFVVMLFLKRQTLPSLWVFFAIYLVAIPVLTMRLSAFNILRWIKLLSGLLMAYYYFDDEKTHDDTDVFLAFILGFLGSSFTRLLDSRFFRIERFIDEIDTVGDGGAEYRGTVRFSGLSNDANYYAVNLIIALCLLIILLYQGKVSIPVFAVLAAALLYFDVATYSKSAMLMLVIPASVFAYAVKKANRRSLNYLFRAMVVLVGLYLVISKGGPFEIVLSRMGSGSGDIDKLTTGRTRIWRYNLEFFKENPGWLIIGRGINAALINGRAHHNAYIEFLYHLGLIGTGLLLGLIKQIAPYRERAPKRNLMNYSALSCVLIMYMFLSILVYYDFPFHIMLALNVLNLNLERQEYMSLAAERKMV
ncbi:MAG: O-antigen ligase family protein [Aristaeellaceae bacterium]